jgi:thiamine biosynthesis protein ThiI
MLAVVRYHEIALKGANRPRFVARLAGNLQRACADLGLRRIRPASGRLVLEFAADATNDGAWAAIRARIERVFGIANFSRAITAPRDLARLEAAVVALVAGVAFDSFRISCKRADKTYPLTSPEICRAVGTAVGNATGRRVDLEHPDLTIEIEMLQGEALVSAAKYTGPGGLPVGSGGHVVALLSGGIDSPVAAARLMRRGCRVTFVHFHGAPYLDTASQEKARELAVLLTRFQYRSELYLVPFGELQRDIVVAVPRPHRVVLYRRLMLRIAEAIARVIRAEALVTGESLGQVASQTLRNLATIDAAVEFPILRPLVGTDKNEIIAEAERIGTYTTSILPDQDCCQLFVPRHPSTGTSLAQVCALEATFDVAEACRRGVAAAVVERFHFPRSARDDAPDDAGVADAAVARPACGERGVVG